MPRSRSGISRPPTSRTCRRSGFVYPPLPVRWGGWPRRVRAPLWRRRPPCGRFRPSRRRSPPALGTHGRCHRDQHHRPDKSQPNHADHGYRQHPGGIGPRAVPLSAVNDRLKADSQCSGDDETHRSAAVGDESTTTVATHVHMISPARTDEPDMGRYLPGARHYMLLTTWPPSADFASESAPRFCSRIANERAGTGRRAAFWRTA